MAKASSCSILQTIRGLVEDPRVKELGDHELLRRFVAEHDEAAFQALLRRHGPVVLDVCRSMLANPADVEDAFQATLLVFARKARGIREATSLGSWLYGVAYRTTLKAREAFAKRLKHESLVPTRACVESTDDLTWRDARAAIHRELNALPERFRAVLVLCYLEGKTQDEAAHQLNLPKGTLKGWLERGRALLRERLIRRGLGPAAVLAVAAWSAAESMALPPALLESTACAATNIVAGRAVSGLVPARVITIMEGVVKAMHLTKLKVATALLLVLSVIGVGAGTFLQAPLVAEQVVRTAQAAPPQQPPTVDPDRAAAEWVIGMGGRIQTAAGYFAKGDPLGDGPFHITAIRLESNDKVTDNDLACLEGLTKLNNLYLADIPVGGVGLKHLAGLTSLESLYLPYSKVGDAGLAHLKGMTGLVNLYLDGTNVTDAGLEHLPAMTGLRVLSLRQTPITDAGLTHLKAMPQLCWLELGGTKVTDDGLKELQAALPNCKINNLRQIGNRPADPQAAAVATIQRLGGKIEYDDRKNVQRVDLSRSQVTDADLAHFQGLTELGLLDLYDTVVTDAGLEHLKGLTKLKFLMLKQTHVTDAGAKKLQQALPNCLISHWPRTPAPPAMGLPVGQWVVVFANGVRQVCEIRKDGTATVSEPQRSSDGKATVKGGSVVITFDDDRVERWTPVGQRLVVEHWFPGSQLPTATPVLGIAEPAQ